MLWYSFAVCMPRHGAQWVHSTVLTHCAHPGHGNSLLTWDEDMHHCSTWAFWFRVDSMWIYSSPYCSFHPSPSAWLLLEETQICSCFGGNPTVWHGLGVRRASGNGREKHSWKPFELPSASITKEMLLRTEDPPNHWLELLSHSQLRRNNSQGQMEAEVLLASSWESTR